MRPAARVALSALCLALAVPTLAKRPPEPRPGLEVLPDESEPSLRTGASRLSGETGVPLALYRVNYAVRAAEPEAMARQYLAENAAALGLRRADLSDLAHKGTRAGAATTTVRFTQTHQGVPVYGSEVAVTLDRQARVTFVMNGYKPRVELPTVSPTLGPAAARRIALGHLGLRARPRWERMDLVVWHAKGRSRLAHRLRVEPGTDLTGDWEVLVDAQSGEVFRSQDLACYHEPATTATGSATVFNPDPLSSAQVSYGATGYVDGGDADTAQLTSQLAAVSLLDIDFTAGIHTLKGPYAEIQDFESPFKGLFTQAGSVFNATRNPDVFEAANTYYHIDTLMRYINTPGPGGLGLTVLPYQYSGGVRFDPHGLNGADNSHYLSGSGRVSFGEGGVDDDEDADVIIHEMLHVIGVGTVSLLAYTGHARRDHPRVGPRPARLGHAGRPVAGQRPERGQRRLHRAVVQPQLQPVAHVGAAVPLGLRLGRPQPVLERPRDQLAQPLPRRADGPDPHRWADLGHVPDAHLEPARPAEDRQGLPRGPGHDHRQHEPGRRGPGADAGRVRPGLHVGRAAHHVQRVHRHGLHRGDRAGRVAALPGRLSRRARRGASLPGACHNSTRVSSASARGSGPAPSTGSRNSR